MIKVNKKFLKFFVGDHRLNIILCATAELWVLDDFYLELCFIIFFYFNANVKLKQNI